MSMSMSDKLMADLYVLANDVLKNFYQQRHGYKGSFYYAFNPDLKFMACDGSDIQQGKLLQQLADKDMFDIPKEIPPNDIPLDFISSNAQKNKLGVTYYLTIKPDSFNNEFEILKKYQPQELKANFDRLQLSVPHKIDPNTLRVHPRSYDEANRVLTLDGLPFPIMDQKKRATETKQATLVKMLFGVKYFYDGVGLSKIYPVKDHQSKFQQVKKAELLVAEINSKLPAELIGQELIKFDKVKFYIHPQYKKK
jgi:hypothetical protein